MPRYQTQCLGERDVEADLTGASLSALPSLEAEQPMAGAHGGKDGADLSQSSSVALSQNAHMTSEEEHASDNDIQDFDDDV